MITMLLPKGYNMKVTEKELQLICTALGWTANIESSYLVTTPSDKVQMLTMRDEIVQQLDSIELGQK